MRRLTSTSSAWVAGPMPGLSAFAYVMIALSYVTPALGAELTSQPTSRPTSVPTRLTIRVLAGGMPRTVGVLLRTSAGVRRLYVPKEGLVVPHPGEPSSLSYYSLGFPSSSAENGWYGQVHLRGDEGQAEVALREVPVQDISIRVLDEKGKPIRADGVRIIYYLDDTRISDRKVPLNSDGEATVRVLSEGTYEVVWPRPGRVASRASGRVSSGMFVPKERADKPITLRLTPLESVVFTVLFVVREGDRERPIENMHGCELVWDGGGAVYSVKNGKMYLDIGQEAVKGQVVTGLECGIRLSDQVAARYALAPGSDRLLVGKPGQSGTLTLVPLVRTKVRLKVVSAEGDKLRDVRAVIRPVEPPQATKIQGQDMVFVLRTSRRLWGRPEGRWPGATAAGGQDLSLSGIRMAKAGQQSKRTATTSNRQK